MKNVHPLTAFSYIILVTLGAALFSDPLTVLTALCFGVIFALLTGTEGFGRVGIIVIAASFISPLFVHRGVTVLFFINDRPITLEAFLFGINSGAMLGSVLLWFSAYNKITDTEKLLYLFSRLSSRFGLTLSMALRAAPLFLRTYNEILKAQRAMGLYSFSALADRIRLRLSAFSATVTMVFENGVVTAASMEARGYGRGRRTGYHLFRFRTADGAMLLAALLLGGAVAVYAKKLRFWFYPQISPLLLLPVPRAAYLLLCLIPVTVEITEKIKWKYLR